MAILILKNNPSNGGRSMNNHFGTRLIDENGDWKNLLKQKNSSADISSTAGQMPRMLGLALASKLYRKQPSLQVTKNFSHKGNEVVFGTIGDASTSEGHFWEVVNAAGVLQLPLALSVWDDSYGISVERKLQTIKDSISKALQGFKTTANEKEDLPENTGTFTVPLGIPEIITQGTDITIVTYGSCVRIARQAINQLKEFDISCELVDVQTLLPFDIPHSIKKSLQKTNRVLFFDEDVPGGATAFMMQKVIEEQKGYYYLDSEPKTLSAQEHRPAYSSDGDYFSNPNAEDVFEAVYKIMHESNPQKYPMLYYME